MIFTIIGWLLLIAFVVSSIFVVIYAFQKDVLKGLLCLFIPMYVFYYAIALFDHKFKGLILRLMALGMFGAPVFLVIGAIAGAKAPDVAEDDDTNTEIEQTTEIQKSEPIVEKKLVEIAVSQSGWCGSWGPENRRLLLNQGNVNQSSNDFLVWYDVESEIIRKIAKGGKDGVWAPAGEKLIAFHRNGSIFICDENGRNAVEVTHGSYPSWSGDGKRVFYYDDRDKWIKSIDAINPKAAPKKIFECPSHPYPAVSPDGSKVAFYKDTFLQVVDIQSGNVIAKHSVDGWNGLVPSWSPDGKYVTFGDYAWGDSAGVWALNVTSGRANQIIRGNFTCPHWSPDGTKIVCDHRPSPHFVQVFYLSKLNLPE